MQKLAANPHPPAAAADSDADARRGRGRLTADEARKLEADLLGAAEEAFTREGYGATSMAALARTARVSKTTLYAKFPSKAALFRAIVERQLELAYGAAQQTAGAAPKTLAGSLSHLAEQTLKAALEPQSLRLNRLIEWESPRFPELAEMARDRRRRAIALVASYIRAFAVEDGVPCRDPEAAAELFTFMVRGFYHDIQVGARSGDPDEIRAMVEKIVDAFLANRSRW